MEDLLDFGAAPAPAPAAGVSAEFGAFEGSSAPAPTTASDEFADFDQIRSKSKGPDPFAATPTPAPAAFDAFGNNNAGGANNNMMNNNMMGNNMMNNNMMGNNMMNSNMMNNNNNNINNNMAAVGNAFGNMNVGAPAGGMQQPAMPASNDDDFGDFEAAKVNMPAIATKSSSNPMSGLINLDGLSKNPSKKMTMNQPVVPGAAAAQYQQAMQNGVQNGGQAQGTRCRDDFFLLQVLTFEILTKFHLSCVQNSSTSSPKLRVLYLQAAVMLLVPCSHPRRHSSKWVTTLDRVECPRIHKCNNSKCSSNSSSI